MRKLLDIPHFVIKEYPPKPTEKTMKKNIVIAYVKNPRDTTFLCLHRTADNAKTFVGGGIEAGEDPVEAAKREVHEETGYKNIRFVSKLPSTSASYWHQTKNANYETIDTNLYFELETEEKDTVDLKETAKHSYAWISQDQVLSYLTCEDQQYVFSHIQRLRNNVPCTQIC